MGPSNRATGRIISAHANALFWSPLQHQRNCYLAQNFKLKVIEDAAEALGSFMTENTGELSVILGLLASMEIKF